MRSLRTIETPWTPYTVMFSRDGTRLAIGGGTFFGDGGIAIVELATGAHEVLPTEMLPPHVHERPLTVSGVWFSPDDRHLLASTWSMRYQWGPTLVFEVQGSRLAYRCALGRKPKQMRDSPTDIAVAGARAIVRHFHSLETVSVDEALEFEALPPEIARDPAPEHITNRRVVIRDGCAITGCDGIVRREAPARILRVPLDEREREREASWIAVDEVRRVTAIGLLSSGGVISGGHGGELDLWDGSWQRRRLRGATAYADELVDPGLLWAMYPPNSITAICAVPGERGFVAASALGELTTWDGEHLAEMQLAARGTPRSLAAHPDGGAIAVGLKRGRNDQPHSVVELLELAPLPIALAWRTPRVLAMARAADAQRSPSGTLEAAPLAILADALEDAGCSDARVRAHLHEHDPRLRVCRVLDTLLAG